MIVYSITRMHSFHEVSKFIDIILREKDVDNVPMVIVGTKARDPCCYVLGAACVAAAFCSTLCAAGAYEPRAF